MCIFVIGNTFAAFKWLLYSVFIHRFSWKLFNKGHFETLAVFTFLLLLKQTQCWGPGHFVISVPCSAQHKACNVNSLHKVDLEWANSSASAPSTSHQHPQMFFHSSVCVCLLCTLSCGVTQHMGRSKDCCSQVQGVSAERPDDTSTVSINTLNQFTKDEHPILHNKFNIYPILYRLQNICCLNVENVAPLG